MTAKGELSVIGAGSWGTALAIAASGQGYRVRLWAYETELAQAMAATRENAVFLPGFALPEAITPTDSLPAAVTPLLIVATPSHALRATLERLQPHLPAAAELVLATKGLEQGTLLRVSEVALAALGAGFASRLATLSGPTFAREIAAGEPAAVVLAATHHELAVRLQQRLSSATLRFYTTADVTGVELAASLKNVIAIAAGICAGLGLGSNTRAALIARGLAEITRLAVACGGQAETLAGLAGLGDLVLTCTGELSRNRAVGVALAQGRSLDEIQAATPMVAEGVATTQAAVALAARRGVELPIARQMQRVLFEGLPARQALDELMQRPLKTEAAG